MWFHDPRRVGVDHASRATPPALGIALTLSTLVVVVIGVYPQLFARVGELAFPRLSADLLAERIRREGPDPLRPVRRRRPLRRATPGSSPAAGAPAGRGATSSPAPRSARCSARGRRARSTRLVARPGRARPVRRRRGGRGPGPARGRRAPGARRRARRALRYVLVERSAALRDAQRELLAVEPFEDALGPAVRDEPDEAPRPVPGVGPIVSALAELPGARRCARRRARQRAARQPAVPASSSGATHGWLGDARGRRTTATASSRWRCPRCRELAAEADRVAGGAAIPAGARLPVPRRDRRLAGRGVRPRLRRGRLILVDYADHRGVDGGARAARVAAHLPASTTAAAARSSSPGSQDITCDVPVEHLVHAAGAQPVSGSWRHRRSASGCRRSGSTSSSTDARRRWDERAAVGDLEALAARSWISEAAALTDPAGLGGHAVFIFDRAVAAASAYARSGEHPLRPCTAASERSEVAGGSRRRGRSKPRAS